MIEVFEYSTFRLSIIIIFSIMSFFWTFKIPVYRVRVWYIMLVLSLLIYSGIGGAIVGVNEGYVYRYLIYILTLSLTLRYYYKINSSYTMNKKNVNLDLYITVFIDKYGKKLISLYFILLLFDLVYPIFRLHLLLNPPTPSLNDLHYKAFVIGDTKDILSQIVYLFQQLMIPFFYISLYKYRENLKIPLLLLLLTVYIDLCNRGIFGRGEAMIPIVIVFLLLYEKLNSKKRKLILFCGLFAIPVVSYLFVQFSFLRIGGRLVDISFVDSLKMVLGQEVSFPLHYNNYISKSSPISILDYLLWIVLLPLPGFLKFGYGDPQVNLKFTMMVTGLDPSQGAFSICLPGLIGESIIVFGKYLFPFHAMILGVIISYMIRYLSKLNSCKFLLLYVAITFSYSICRGGTASSYSFAFKQFIFFLLFIFWIKRKYMLINKNTFLDLS